MKIDHEKFSNITSGLQHIAVSVAVVVGGIWSLYVFRATLNIADAKARVARLERDLREQTVLDIEVTASQVEGLEKNNRFVSGVLVIRNSGNRNTVLTLRPDSLIIVRADRSEAFLASTSPPSTIEMVGTPIPLSINPRQLLTSKVCLAGSTDRIPFLVRVEEPGIYRLFFRSPRDTADQKTAEDSGRSPPGAWLWNAGTYVVVR